MNSIECRRVTAVVQGAALCISACGVLVAGNISAARAADASNGMRVAEQWCAACHVVTIDQVRAPTLRRNRQTGQFQRSGPDNFSA
jgi:mono/diheme cytochrome c family protein